MRPGRIILGTVLFLALGAVIWWVLTVYWDMQQPKPQDYAGLVKAMQNYSRDKMAAGQATPDSVSLQELVSSGYVSVSDVKAFSGMDVSLSLNGDVNRLQDFVIRVRFPDGSVISHSLAGTVQEPLKN
jgi:hypothetical protein